MPAIPGKTTRRRAATPITKQQQEDVWRRTLAIMGLDPLTENSANKTSTVMADTPGVASPTATPSAAAKKTSILDLPLEAQKDIFRHAAPTDLIALSLVSKHFRDIAAEQLYRSFHIVFPDDDDPSNEVPPIDGLAGGLDTFVTSDYDYAKYLREIILETLSGGDKGERSYRDYTYNTSCGKFMNTLLFLTLGKARAVETFKWDIRVELSREVFRSLHGIQALQNLHLRMHAGHSIYQTPPALPASNGPPLSPIYIGGPPPPPGPNSHPIILSAGPPIPTGIGAFPVGTFPNSFPLGNKFSTKLHQKHLKSILPKIKTTPPTLSGFKNLKTLSILDMDTLDYIDELKLCVRNCSSTLSSLKLSFSETLANKSRKPPPEIQSDDDSDQEDEFGQLIPPPGLPPGNPNAGASDPNGPSKVLRAQEEKKKQEAVMGRIFDLEPVLTKPRPIVPTILETMKEAKADEDPKKRFIRNLAPVAAKLMGHLKPGSDLTAEGKETLAMIEKAAKLYIDSIDKVKEKPSAASGESSTAKPTPATSDASTDGGADDDTMMSGAGDASDEPGLFDKPEPKKKKGPVPDIGVSNPEDIDIEEPEGKELSIEFGAPSAEAHLEHAEVDALEGESSSSPVDDIDWANRLHVHDHHLAIRQSHEEIEREGENLKKRMDEFKSKLEAGELKDADYQAIADAEAEFQRVAARVEELSRHMQDVNDHIDELRSNGKLLQRTGSPAINGAKMSEYVRTTRGLTLTTLSIYLIPLKASVLSRAIDLNVLQNITLLNVGPQTPFWNLLARENKLSPLPLRNIHTDNVTLPLLALISQLDTVTELFFLERTAKARVESTAAKTTVTMEQIRKLVLKKHAGSLRILMIRNDAGVEWDLNIKTVMLLCKRAKLLEELACSFGVRIMHTLLQFLPGLVSLRALHTIMFRTDDTCVWVMREFRKFTVDNVSHNPEMKLEYLALDTSVERLVRRKPKSKGKDKKGKGKDIDSISLSVQHLSDVVMNGPGMGWGSGSDTLGGSLMNGYDWESSADDETNGLGMSAISMKTGLRVETIEGIRFCDVVGVRIFERDVLSGRL